MDKDKNQTQMANSWDQKLGGDGGEGGGGGGSGGEGGGSV